MGRWAWGKEHVAALTDMVASSLALLLELGHMAMETTASGVVDGALQVIGGLGSWQACQRESRGVMGLRRR